MRQHNLSSPFVRRLQAQTQSRFCDSSARSKQGEVHVLSDVLAESWPVLNDIAQSTLCRSNEAVLSGLLDVHSQVISRASLFCLLRTYFKL